MCGHLTRLGCFHSDIDTVNAHCCYQYWSPLVTLHCPDLVETEAYLGRANDSRNYLAYQRAALGAARLAGVRLLAVHGTADSVVALRQSMTLARDLTDHNIIFQQQVRGEVLGTRVWCAVCSNVLVWFIMNITVLYLKL